MAIKITIDPEHAVKIDGFVCGRVRMQRWDGWPRPKPMLMFYPYEGRGFGAEALQTIAKWMEEYTSGSL